MPVKLAHTPADLVGHPGVRMLCMVATDLDDRYAIGTVASPLVHDERVGALQRSRAPSYPSPALVARQEVSP
jgi:hypothetical protein